jgi:GLPGLI family protein
MKGLLVFMLLMTAANIYSQVVSGRVYYQQILNLDSTSRTKKVTGKRSVLYFTDTLSYYVYNNTETIKDDKATGSDETGNTYDIAFSDDIGEVFMTSFRTKQVFIREFIWKRPYITVDTLTEINWVLTGEEKNIGRFVCQKALAFFRGRNFEAWFTTAVPVTVGPWKLHGLPGLILEACDEKKEVCYLFDGLQVPDKKIFSLRIPGNGKRVPLKQFRNLWKEEIQKLRDFLEATAEKGTTVDVNVKYFPMEKSYD